MVTVSTRLQLACTLLALLVLQQLAQAHWQAAPILANCCDMRLEDTGWSSVPPYYHIIHLALFGVRVNSFWVSCGGVWDTMMRTCRI